MTSHIGRYTNDPRAFTGALTQGEREDIWGPMPGAVVSYDPAKQTATVRPLISKRRYDGTPLPLPDLLDVPVDMPRGAGGAITFPIKPGDRVTLTPSMRTAEGFDTGEDINDPRSFNLSDMRASVTGGDPLTDPLPAVDPDNVHFRFGPDGDFGIKGSPDGKVAIEGAQGNIYTILAEAVRLLAQAETVVAAGSSTGFWEHDQKAAVLALADKLDAMAI